MKQNKEVSPPQWIILEKLVKATTNLFLLISHLRKTCLCYNLQDHRGAHLYWTINYATVKGILEGNKSSSQKLFGK